MGVDDVPVARADRPSFTSVTNPGLEYDGAVCAVAHAASASRLLKATVMLACEDSINIAPADRPVLLRASMPLDRVTGFGND